MPDRIDGYVAELGRRLKRHLPEQKLAEVLQETEAHLREKAQQPMGDEMALREFGPASLIAQQYIGEVPDRALSGYAWVAIAPAMFAILGFLIYQVDFTKSIWPLTLAIGTPALMLVMGLSQVKGWHPVRMSAALALGLFLMVVMHGLLFVSRTEGRHAVLVPRNLCDQYQISARANLALLADIRAKNWGLPTKTVYTSLSGGVLGSRMTAKLQSFETLEQAQVAKSADMAPNAAYVESITRTYDLEDETLSNPRYETFTASSLDFALSLGNRNAFLLMPFPATLILHTLIALLRSAWPRRHRLFPPRSLA